MFQELIDNIISEIVNVNKPFAGNAFNYKDTISFESGGISDSYKYMFYIRPIIKGSKKYVYKHGDLINTITSSFRLVIQVPKDTNSPLQSFVSIINKKVTISGWNDDSSSVLQSEKNESKYPSFDLYSIDFDIILETANSCDIECM